MNCFHLNVRSTCQWRLCGRNPTPKRDLSHTVNFFLLQNSHLTLGFPANRRRSALDPRKKTVQLRSVFFVIGFRIWSFGFRTGYNYGVVKIELSLIQRRSQRKVIFSLTVFKFKIKLQRKGDDVSFLGWEGGRGYFRFFPFGETKDERGNTLGIFYLTFDDFVIRN